MKVEAILTSLFVQDMNLLDFILDHVQKLLKEKSILVVTSKIVSIAEKRVLKKKRIKKKTLIQNECEHYLTEVAYGCHLTIQHGLFVPSAGIDESNSINDEYILYPENPIASAKKLVNQVRKMLGIRKLGIILVDSHTLPLRRGVVGVALAYSGFIGVKNLVGQPDLFGRPLKMTYVNLADSLAVSAVVLMGEGDARRPLAVIDEAPVVFSKNSDPDELSIPVDEDIYFPLYRRFL